MANRNDIHCCFVVVGHEELDLTVVAVVVAVVVRVAMRRWSQYSHRRVGGSRAARDHCGVV